VRESLRFTKARSRLRESIQKKVLKIYSGT
jgi:hypothetical protein